MFDPRGFLVTINVEPDNRGSITSTSTSNNTNLNMIHN
jgi:hypothetical protein